MRRRRTSTGCTAAVTGLWIGASLALTAMPAAAQDDAAAASRTDPRAGAEIEDRLTASNQSVSLSAETPGDGRRGGEASEQGPQTKTSPRSMVRGAVEPVRGEGAAHAAPWYSRGMVPLALVLAVIAVTCLAVRRLMPARATIGSGALRIVSRTALSPRHSVALIQVGAERMVLVGIATDRITALSDISSAEEVARLLGRVGEAPAGGAFRSMLAARDEDFEDVVEDVGDSLADDPRATGGARVRLGGLVDRLQRLREQVKQ